MIDWKYEILGLAGPIGSGKNAVANYLEAEYGFKIVAFADALKEGLAKINPIIDTWATKEHGEYVGREVRLSDVLHHPDYTEEHLKVDYPEYRRLLQVIGTDFVRDTISEYVWIDKLHDRVDEQAFQAWLKHNVTTTRFVVTDVRFPNELEYVFNPAPGTRCTGHGCVYVVPAVETQRAQVDHVSERGILEDTLKAVATRFDRDQGGPELSETEKQKVDKIMEEMGIKKHDVL